MKRLALLLAVLFLAGCSAPAVTTATTAATTVTTTATTVTTTATVTTTTTTTTTTVAPTPPPPLAGKIIGLDPGHQAHGNADQEPVAPGSSQTKKKVSSGTSGPWSGVDEYVVNLEVALALRDALEAQGATVVMTREIHAVDISNVQRAQVFNEARVDYALRIHCDGTSNPDRHGAHVLYPAENPYQEDCIRAAQLLVDAYCGATGFKNLGINRRSDLSGFNWCERMTVLIEMGYMSNQSDDLALSDPAMREKMVSGILAGILAYFE